MIAKSGAPSNSNPDPRGAASGAAAHTGTVTRIVDGDTFWMTGLDVRVRVWGLDAPERNTPEGPAATAALARLISNESLSCRERDIDRYGRIVGQCFLADGTDIAAAMIQGGTSREYCRFSRNYYGTCRAEAN